MADNPLVVSLLREYKDEASATRKEVAKILNTERVFVVGICRRNNLDEWPFIPVRVKKNRGCQFPINQPGTSEFDICGTPRSNDPLLCNEHKDKAWVPQCKVLSMKL